MYRVNMALAGVAALSSLVSGLDLNLARSLSGVCPRNEDYARLGRQLSSGAKIYFPGSSDFNLVSVRWSNLSPPNASVAVVPATEDDVATTVKFANEKNIPFLAYNTAHGALTTLGRMKNGIEIYINQLNSIDIAADGKTVKLGGGARSKEVTYKLFEAGKQTVTGTCECVSMMGPALGGGHGWLQGHYGLVADNIISYNVVLADGSQITVNASSDLFYGLKGAGHNFGIVTSVVAKIYDVTKPNWAINTMIFSGDKVEAVYAAANEHYIKDGNQDPSLINWSYWLMSSDLDSKPIIIFYIIQEGVDVVDAAYTEPFAAIGPLVSTPISGNYTQVSGWANVAESSPPCEKAGMANPRFPIYLQKYNSTAMRAAYDLYASEISSTSSPFFNSIFMFEGYPSQGLRKVDAASTAFAHRDENLLNAPLIQYKPGVAEGIDARAAALGNQLRQILQDGAGRSGLPPAYVNYGYGTEDQTQFYGADAGRIEKLCTLKRKYDPSGKFSFYAPLKC